MTTSGIASAVRSRWLSNWTYTPATYDNESFTPDPDLSWARLVIRDGNGLQISLGSPSLDRHTGIVFIQIFTPDGDGETRARWLADKAADIFRKTSFSSMRFDVPSFSVLGNQSDGWFQLNVLCPYTLDEVT